MDDDLNQKADELADNVEDAATNTWEQVEETGRNIVDAVENTTENVWETVEDSHDEAGDFVAEGAETVQGTWSEIEEVKMDQNDEFMQVSAESWSAEEQPTPVSYSQGETNRWGSPVPPQETYQAPETPVGQSIPREEYRSVNTGQVVTPQEKKDFPVWAIVLIILLVLCLCVILPVVLILGGGIALFRNILENTSILLPYLFM
jgi:hypothetical protein